MYTVCPKCALPLAVTAADLRAGQGYVRCGRCANVFNALLRLSDESALTVEESGDPGSLSESEMDKASATMSRPALTEPEPESEPEPAPEPESEPEAPVGSAEPPAPAARQRSSILDLEDPDLEDPEVTNPKIGKAPLDLPPPAAARSPQLWIVDTPRPTPDVEIEIEEEADDESGHGDEDVVDEEELERLRGTGTFETIVLEGDTFLQTEETIPEEVLASEIANVERRLAEANDTAEFSALMRRHFADDAPSEAEAEPAPELAALREAAGEFERLAHVGMDPEDPSTWFATVRRWGDWRLMVAAAALALLLMVQMVNHWRDDLATKAGWFGPMHSLASLFGESLHPNWDLNAYDVRQLGADADSADHQTLKVRLSLTNVGQRAQALPVIRLTLRDRFGKAVSRGELEPEQYLPPALQGQQMIRRDQRIDTEVRVLDPTRQASSFELDVCVTAAGGGLRCAGDAPALAARPS